MSGLRIATFKVDISPPIGSPLCGGLVPPAQSIAAPLYAIGVVLVDASGPMVLCSLDWCELRCQDHLQWRTQLAEAAGTSPDRVAVHCVHQHDAPLVDHNADVLLRECQDMEPMIDAAWSRAVPARAAASVKAAMNHLQPLSHVAVGSAMVEHIASNRRILGDDGKVRVGRMSACRDRAIAAAPEGTIDPCLKLISFWNGDHKIAVLYYYATHPMSDYGHGHVDSDFAGEARERLAAADGAVHVYFNGCAGNIAAGKYNDGSPEARRGLTERLLAAMKVANDRADRMPLQKLTWRTRDVLLEPGDQWRDEAAMVGVIHDAQASQTVRRQTALALAYVRWTAERHPIVLSSLDFDGHTRLLHLPGEPFVEYQLWAQSQYPKLLLAVAGYGDGGPGYIPLEHSFPEGGYEPTWAFASPPSEALLKREMAALLSA